MRHQSSLLESSSSRNLGAIGLGLLSAFFFTMTYVLNRVSATEGGHWTWTACLRYLITLPMLLPLMPWLGGVSPVLRAIKAHPWPWFRNSAIGFVGFYCLLSFAASSGPSWLIAGSFQFTVIAGMLCAPFIYKDARRQLSLAALLIALSIILGVLFMQIGHHQGTLDGSAWLALIAVLGSAVAYPLGNRLLLLHLEKTGETLNATQRVFGMTLVSQPCWIILAVIASLKTGWPSGTQVWLASGVALSAGVIATILFFKATGMVKSNPIALGATEAMQSAELIIAMILGVAFLNESWPQGFALTGAAIIIFGILAFTLFAAKKPNA